MAKHVINNPGGRKPLPEEEKYGKPIPVRFTQKQFVRIKRFSYQTVKPKGKQ